MNKEETNNEEEETEESEQTENDREISNFGKNIPKIQLKAPKISWGKKDE